jgi:hypothetical protein
MRTKKILCRDACIRSHLFRRLSCPWLPQWSMRLTAPIILPPRARNRTTNRPAVHQRPQCRVPITSPNSPSLSPSRSGRK